MQFTHFAPADAQVAQLVEQRTENPRVGGSNPPLGTIIFNDLAEIFQWNRFGLVT